MNDLDELREFRADVAQADPAVLARGRARLLRAAEPATPRKRVGRVLLPVGAVAAAAVVGVVSITLSGSPTVAPVTEPTQPQPALAARLLADASVVVAAQPSIEPAPGQWMYSNTIDYQYPQGRSTDSEWITFDGIRSAYFEDGRLVTHKGPDSEEEDSPKSNYETLAALPTDPTALLAYVDRQISGLSPAQIDGGVSSLGSYAPAKPTHAQLQFDYLVDLLWNAAHAAPSWAVAAVFNAMSTLPGITTQSNILDDAGTPTVAISADGGLTRMLLDPKTYQVRGVQALSNGTDPIRGRDGKPMGPWPAKGAMVASLTYARRSEVSGPGKTS
ncbi:MAG TPA: CU044_5270 family protein [Pseudonocardiaceae bacterium]|jgi:hypothetical protein|nr:CU044_5270 family protein [Pseudonocardiaceae bacterium]